MKTHDVSRRSTSKSVHRLWRQNEHRRTEEERRKYQDNSCSRSNKCIEKTSFQREPAAARKGAGQSRCRKNMTEMRCGHDGERKKKAWGGGAGWQVVKRGGRMRWKVEEHVHDKNEGVKDGWERKREVNHAAVINPRPCVISLHKYLKRRGWEGLYTMEGLMKDMLTSLVFHSLSPWWIQLRSPRPVQGDLGK